MRNDERPSLTPTWTSRGLINARWPEFLAVLLLASLALNLFSALGRKSITNDEVVHIPAGYYHLVAGNYTLNNEHPPLVKMYAALPLLLLQPEEPPLDAPASSDFAARTYAAFGNFWTANGANFEAICFWTRVPMVLLTVAAGWLTFVFARDLFGPTAGVFATALFAFEPTILAHGRIVHTDVPAAFAYTLFFYLLYRYGRAPSLPASLATGVATGVALATKFSLVISGPLLILGATTMMIVAPRRQLSRRRIALHTLAAVIVALLLVNIAYRFQRQPLLAADLAWLNLKTPAESGLINTGLSVLSLLFPTYFLFGIYNVSIHNHFGHAASLLNQHSDVGWWYYFPVAFALKTSLPFLAVAVVSLGAAVWQVITRRRATLAFLLAPIALYSAVAFTSGINIGIRHFLPVYPFLFILGGWLLDRLWTSTSLRQLCRIGVVVVISLMGVEALRAYPDYVSYFNQLAGSTPRWRLLSDSNVEWGDDAKELAEYLKQRGETRVRAALSAGWLTLRFYGVEYVDLCSSRQSELPRTKYVAVGASFLNGSTTPGVFDDGDSLSPDERTNFFSAYRTQVPEAVFGNSIFLFRAQ